MVRTVLALVGVVLLASLTALGQVSTVGSLAGTVADPTGAVVAGAAVTVKDDATGRVYETKSGADGGFYVGNLPPGSYTVTVVLQGFKTAEVRAVKVVVGQQRGLNIPLELGEVASTVVIEGGAEVLETTQTTIGTTITGKAITQLPFSSRDTLDLAVLMPGAATVGRPRTTSFLGLPKGAINITLDGINVQDQVLKSSDGFFTNIRPRTDTIEEFSISTANQGANEAGEGAVQIRFETKRGGNEFHGGAWWFHRNDKFNSNYFFNNQAGTSKQKQRLNQFGVKVGGPIIPDKLFFFTALDFFRNPESQSRTRTILTDEATSGLFRYNVSSPPTLTAQQAQWTTCSGTQCVVNVMAMAGNFGFTTATDPLITGFLNAMNSSVNVPGVGQLATTSVFQRVIAFNNGGAGRRNFPDFRFDYNAGRNHSITGIYHYNYFTSTPDFLNGFDASFPVAPFTNNQGSQISNRNQFVGAWRWNIGTNKSNEIRAGLTSSPLTFFPDLNPTLYPQINTNLGGLRVRPVLPGIVNQPLLGFATQGRNGGVFQLIETFSWSKGKHNLTMGGNWSEIRLVEFFVNGGSVGTVNLGMATTDPASGIFSSGNMPGSSTTDRGNASSLYAMLTGRVTGFTANNHLDLETRQFTPGLPLERSTRQSEIALFFQDSYRFRPTLTFNAGVRWDYQGAPRDRHNISFRNTGASVDEALAGVSGSVSNLFQPGAGNGALPGYTLNGSDPWYNRDLNNFAPNVGFAWTPNYDNAAWRAVFGGPGKTVLRGGYSISYTREGLNNWLSMAYGNPGFLGGLSSTASTTAGPGTFVGGSVLLSSGFVPNVISSPASFVENFSLNPVAGQSVNLFNPDLGMPYVQSWSLGIQRELTASTVVEVRYVGNHGTGLWRQYNLNEVNIFENGFLNEFLAAQSNLAICKANQPACAAAAGTSSTTFASYGNLGLAGQVPLPIMTAAFTGSTTGSQTNANFSSGPRITNLDNNAAGSFAGVLSGTLGFWNNIQAAGLPANFWVLNPHARGGSFLYTNDSHTNYNGLTVEVRRRLANGLQYSANYTFSKGLTNNFADSSLNFAAFSTLRNKGRDKGPSPFDLRHAFKMSGIYELPFGPGKRWSTSNAILGRVIGGWEIGTITRWQSGRTFNVTGGLGGTVNGADGGVELIGITPQQIQSQLGIRKLPDGRVFWWPESLLDANQERANSSVLRACSTPGEFCQRLFLTGPSFFRTDINIVKKTKINEKVNIEYRAEFLNAFNNINFFYAGSPAAAVSAANIQSTSFGRVTEAFRDVSTTDDPGGRIIQMVLRINF